MICGVVPIHPDTVTPSLSASLSNSNGSRSPALFANSSAQKKQVVQLRVCADVQLLGDDLLEGIGWAVSSKRTAFRHGVSRRL